MITSCHDTIVTGATTRITRTINPVYLKLSYQHSAAKKLYHGTIHHIRRRRGAKPFLDTLGRFAVFLIAFVFTRAESLKENAELEPSLLQEHI